MAAQQTNMRRHRNSKDDDNISVICYKDPETKRVGILRIHQQITCDACMVVRGTLSAYRRHLLTQSHCDSVRKLCDENKYMPSIYDKAFHLAFQNGFDYQSERFHFLYKQQDDNDQKSSATNIINTMTDTNEPKMDSVNDKNVDGAELVVSINETSMKSDTVKNTTPFKVNNNQNNKTKRRLEVTLVFQNKKYLMVGTELALIRAKLLEDLVIERNSDVAAFPMSVYYRKKNSTIDEYQQLQTSSDNIIDELNVKSASSVVNNNNNNQNSAVVSLPGEAASSSGTTDSVGIDENEDDTNLQMKFDDIDTISVVPCTVKRYIGCPWHVSPEMPINETVQQDDESTCKHVIDYLVYETYVHGERQRLKSFMLASARRNFRKKNMYYCDICCVRVTSEINFFLHLEDPKHIRNFSDFKNAFLPWRKIMHMSLLTGKPFKNLMGPNLYEEYKQTLGFYCAPTEFVNRGRFMCAYCEQLFHDQWLLEKHLHTAEHTAKKSAYEDKDHKELVVRFANSLFVPAIFRYNGITELADIHHDIKSRYNWRFITRTQLNEDTNVFLNNYPYDTFEGVTRVNMENENIKNGLNNHPPQQQPAQFSRRGTGTQFPSWRKFYPNRSLVNNIAAGGKKVGQPPKRSNSVSVNGGVKRFRNELPPPLPNTNTNLHQRRNGTLAGRGQRARGRGGHIPLGHQNFRSETQNLFPMNVGRQTNMDNRDPNWNNNNFSARPAYQQNIQPGIYSQARVASSSFGDAGYSNYSSYGTTENYDPNFIHAVARAVAQYRPETTTNLNRQIVNPGNATNELIHHVANTIQRSTQPVHQPASMNYSNRPQSDSFGTSYNTGPIRTYADYRSSTGPSSYPPSTTYTPSPAYSSFGNTSSSYAIPSNDYTASNNSTYNRFDDTIPQQNYSSFSSSRTFNSSQHQQHFSDPIRSGDSSYRNQHQQRPGIGGIYRGQRGHGGRNNRGMNNGNNINHQPGKQGQTFSGGRNHRGQNFSSQR
ncbi:unnamed protein product [Didymodactylos carnosus]|nr:unnamed protein product [Didymodactylos carnosus]CAF3605109.1 unnamed protein product [Didymodactylos carnosus]